MHEYGRMILTKQGTIQLVRITIWFNFPLKVNQLRLFVPVFTREQDNPHLEAIQPTKGRCIFAKIPTILFCTIVQSKW